MCNGNIFECYVEFLGTLEKVRSDAVADCFTLVDQFCGVKLGYYGFEDFVADGWEDSFIIILAEILVSLTTVQITLKMRGNILDRS